MMEQILDQYIASVPLRDFQWKQVTVLSPDVQQSILQEVIRSPLAVGRPPSRSYQMAFLKHIMTKTEADGCTVEGELYEMYAELVSLPSTNADRDSLCWKSYHLPNGEYVTLMESTNMLSNGTTGLTTWQAAFRFVEWLSAPDISQLFHSKRVLELGSGLGLTGLAICLQCHPHTYTFTDCHSEVLERLRENVDCNMSKSPGINTEIWKLDWSNDADIASLLESHDHIDYILATEYVNKECCILVILVGLSLGNP